MRTAYLLTTDKESERTKFSIHVLEKIGFNVKLIQHIFNSDKVLSNKMSMMHIYEMIHREETEDWSYIFEDDINTLKDISLNEITEYEKISTSFFYLGCCVYNSGGVNNTGCSINSKPVMSISGGVRGLHAIGISVEGATELLELAKSSELVYMDCILEQFSIKHPANVVRYDLESYIRGHRGIVFQDRNRFPSEIP